MKPINSLGAAIALVMAATPAFAANWVYVTSLQVRSAKRKPFLPPTRQPNLSAVFGASRARSARADHNAIGREFAMNGSDQRFGSTSGEARVSRESVQS